ncbi:MAG: NADPH:quinone reductase [Planctomycetaceae bacterium]|nr:NADPH:quinone reductase [Planctomycetaceae bacterium]
MRAAYITQTGDPEVIQYGEIPDPVPADGEVLIRVEAAAINPIDTYIRSGAIAQPLKFPYTPGCDLAGIVVACGPGTSRFREGDRVWGSNQGLFGRQGACGELAAVREEWLYPTPEGQSSAAAAAGALVGITAHLGLFLHAGLNAGETLFVNGGTGGVGSAVVQFAKAAGARVVTTAGSEAKREHCRALGADVVLDYRSETLDDELRAAVSESGGIDLWWETLREPNLERTIAYMRKRGRIVLMAGRAARPVFPLGAFYVNDLRMVGFAMFNASSDEQRRCAESMNAWYSAGQWEPQIGRTLSLSETAAAHRLQEDNTLQGAGTLSGKIVLVP